MGLFNRPTVPMGETKHGMVSVIQNEGNNASRDLIAWRHPESNFNTHSKLIVRQNEEAIFENGAYIEGVFPEMTECTLDTQNIIIIRSLRDAVSGGSSYFPCRVYFVSTKPFNNVEWFAESAISYDCPILGPGTLLRGGGDYSIRVTDSALFKKEVLADAESFSTDDLKIFLNSRCYKRITKTIIATMRELGVSSLAITDSQEEISERCKPAISTLLAEFGLSLIDFTVALELDDETRLRYENEVRQRRLEGQGKLENMRQMGEYYTTIEGMEILKNISVNPGAGGIASAGAGLGMGMAAGSAFGSIANSVFGNVISQQPQQPPTTPSFGGTNRFGGVNTQPTANDNSDILALEKLKMMLDKHLITQEVYDAKLQEILSRI